MKKSIPPANPEAYINGLSGWQRVTVQGLRDVVVASARLDEVIKWISARVVRRLVEAAVGLNETPGNPTNV